MGFCIQLSSEREIGLDAEFHRKLEFIGLFKDWNEYIASQLMSGKPHDVASLRAHGKRFCHLRGVAALIDLTVLMSRVPKRSGYVARFPVLESVLLNLGLKEEWDEYFLGRAFVLLDNDGIREPSNWGIYWHDVDRFFSMHNHQLVPLIEHNLPHDTVMSIVKGNLKLSNLNLSDEQFDVVSLASNGLISNEVAIKRLKKLRN
ncbi:MULTISPECIES: hypothetical protein [unclassified Neptuniibacter]|uniref:hypothetical protein n=1 Tax=unclassified Neptuniibacter TaxID=2630693 RepID=UPI000C614CE2|nr:MULTISPECIES: hypothetical protein [unclassified Neptuniibacter]MAY43506.1 hypothetical protein [Oceanospirillaceae bacterium]